MTTSTGKPTVRPKSAAVNTREYDEAAMHKRFVPISEAIHARAERELGFNPVDVTPRSLSLLTGNLRHFVEVTLGREAPPQWKRLTKFPHSLFLDYNPAGALDIMLCACLNFKALHGLRRLEFSNIDKRDFYFDLLLRIEKNLKQARRLPMVKVFFARTVPTSVQPSLRAIVQKRGVVVSTAAAATHIVYSDPLGSTAAETDGTDYCRALLHRDKAALVHWWYYPDSYDSWIPREDVDGAPDPPEQHDGPWHVQIRWLQDTEMFNEWMNEIDYEIPDESRITVIPGPRADTPTATAKDTKSPKTESEKASKKRRRMSTSSSSKQIAVSDRDVGPNTSSARTDRISVADLTDDSDEGTIRKPKRHSESGKDRKRRDSSGSAKPGRDSAHEGHARKKPRLVETGEHRHRTPMKVRVRLRPPVDKLKERSKDRVRDRKGESARPAMREKSIDLRDVNIRVKLPKSVDAKRVSELVEAKISARDMPKESDNDNVSTARRMPASKAGEEKSASADQGKEGAAKSDVAALPPKQGQKPSGADDAAEDGAPEQKRPFSRRRSKKKERRSHNRMSGVSMVDDAVPIPEGEIPRIRNISTEGRHVMSTNVASGSEVDEEVMDRGMKREADVVSGREKGKTSDAGRSAMDVDTGYANGRAMAVSERMLSGGAANAPASSADVVDALPVVAVRIPAHARWFRMDAIHDIERRSLPEFWNSRGESKTPLVYKKYRDFMIDVWRQTPDKYLTATAARRHLAGDVCAILRVHTFLEYWGLINYGTEPESKPYLNSALRPRHSRPSPMEIDASTPRPANGVPRLLFFDEPRPPRRDNAPVPLQKAIKTAKEKRERSQVLTRRELYATSAATKYECDACGSDCSRMRYHCVGNADIELCPSCFANGMYPETLSARDFEQLTTVLSSEAYDGSVWSEAEVLLLLEALEKYGDNWTQIADHVGTKTNDQCVLQFLRMPLEDSFLEDQVGNWVLGDGGFDDGDGMQDAIASGEHKFAGPLLPFYDTANPVMAQVAFLAASVDPEVAAAAAQAALNAIMSQSGHKPLVKEEKSIHANVLLQNSGQNADEPTSANGIPDKTSAQNGSNLSNLPVKQLDSVAVEAAAAVGLAAAVGKAKDKLQAETREVDRRYAVAIETKMRSVDLKLKEIERLELHLRRERERLEKQRQRVFAERVDSSVMRIQSEAQARTNVSQPNAYGIVHAGAGVVQNYPGSAPSGQRPPSGMGTMSMQHNHASLQQGQVPSHQAQVPLLQGQIPMHATQLPIPPNQMPMRQGQISMQHAQAQVPLQQRSTGGQPGTFSQQTGPLSVQPNVVSGQQPSGVVPMQTDSGLNK